MLRARVIRPERCGPGSARIDENAALDAAAAGLDGESAIRSLDDRLHDGRSDHLQREMPLVAFVVLGDDVACRARLVGRGKTQAHLVHAGKVAHPVRCAESERLPAKLPGSAGARSAIQDEEVLARHEAQPAQMKSDRESGLPRADNHHRGFGRNISTHVMLNSIPGPEHSRPTADCGSPHRNYFFSFFSVSPDNAAMNASCGTSTRPTIFMRFLPSFCFSRSLRLRVMSPP
jgi:hypothetical protein